MKSAGRVPHKIGDAKKKGELEGLDSNSLEHIENLVLSLKPGDIHKSYQEILDQLNESIEKGGEPKSVLTD